MGVVTTPANYPGFIFDGVNSRTMGAYVTDVTVFDAPARDVEMITIPGRDGAFAFDKKRFDNIQVKYTCAIKTDTDADFIKALQDIRAWLGSRKGYKKLSDEIHTDEFRQAVWTGGLDVPTINKHSGTFEVIFDCKPQRWLNSGSNYSVTVSSGGKMTNPTAFDAKPLLKVYGVGSIFIGDYGAINAKEITIYNQDLGNRVLTNATGDYISLPFGASGSVVRGPRYPYTAWDTAQLIAGDTITIPDITFSITNRKEPGDSGVWNSWGYSITSETFGNNPSVTNQVNDISGILRHCEVLIPSFTFQQGTAWTKTITIHALIVYAGNDHSLDYVLEFKYDGTNKISWKLTADQYSKFNAVVSVNFPSVSGFSTVSTNLQPTYIDLDIGEAYGIVSDEVVSANDAVSLPAELPVLGAGDTYFYYDNTITQLWVTPRWWRL